MSRPLVAVIGRRAARVPILRFSATLAAEAICEAVWVAGGEPVVLHGPAAGPLAELPSRLEIFDGVLMPGGADIDPCRYGADPDPRSADVVAFQDDFDIGVTRVLVDGDVPTLAICRGMQILNVALGGTLVQHVDETNTRHHNAIHPVQVTAGSRLHTIVAVTAVAGDGVAEAVEHQHADIVAVQWHPEDCHATSDTDAALFADLIDRARKRKDSK